eukprot:5127988-Amphidinium_carterae.1
MSSAAAGAPQSPHSWLLWSTTRPRNTLALDLPVTTVPVHTRTTSGSSHWPSAPEPPALAGEPLLDPARPSKSMEPRLMSVRCLRQTHQLRDKPGDHLSVLADWTPSSIDPNRTHVRAPETRLRSDKSGSSQPACNNDVASSGYARKGRWLLCLSCIQSSVLRRCRLAGVKRTAERRLPVTGATQWY